jgi:hypothetical protein
MAKRVELKIVTVGEIFRLEDNERVLNAQQVARRSAATGELEWFWDITIITESKA